MTSRARWAAGARDLTRDVATASTYYEVGKVSDLTGLSEATILDPLTRGAITNPDDPRGALCRPAARVGDVPLWAREQIDDYLRLKQAAELRPSLPAIDFDDAQARRLVSTEEQGRGLDVHDQTIRRWQRSDGTYPPAVGRRGRSGRPGVPEHVREWTAVLQWAESKGLVVPYPFFEDFCGEAFSALPVLSVKEVRGRGLSTTRRLAGEFGLTVGELAVLRRDRPGFPPGVGRANLGEGWREVFPVHEVSGWMAGALRASA